MIWATAKRVIPALQVVTILLAQWILPVRVPPPARQVAADACATTHQCCCASESSCCCCASTEKPVNSFEKLLRAAQCGGGLPSHNAVVASSEFIFVTTPQFAPGDATGADVFIAGETPVSRFCEPDDPPPRSVLFS